MNSILQEGLELISLFDELNYWVFKMKRISDTRWVPREGYTFEECEEIRNALPAVEHLMASGR